jgi:RimJ/RimL family protein N-acetyltransferase
MVLRVVAHDDAEVASVKENISAYTAQYEPLGLPYWVFLSDKDVVGLVFVGKEPLQLLAPVGTPLSRFYLVDFQQPVSVLEEFLSEALKLAKAKKVDYAYLIFPAKHTSIAKHLVRIGFDELANRYEMTHPLDTPIESPGKLQFRRLTREELDQFFPLMKKFMSGSSDNVLDIILQNLENIPKQALDMWFAQITLFLVYLTDEIVGILDLRPQAGWINNIGVAPSHRGKGLGSEMLQFCLQLFQDEGCKEAKLGVSAVNTRAIHVYKKLGFSIDKHLQTFIWQK